MEEKPWWPRGIVTKVVDDKIHTTWGTLSYWWDEDILSPAWWNSKKDYWGMWPKEVNKVEIIEEDSRGLIVDVDDYVARILSYSYWNPYFFSWPFLGRDYCHW